MWGKSMNYELTEDDKRIIANLKLPSEKYKCLKCGKDYIIREGIKLICVCGASREFKIEKPTEPKLLD
jgi:DNA-directed RNA polymerase subunit RPC12/RpoP